jgi:hypothetical protein
MTSLTLTCSGSNGINVIAASLVGKPNVRRSEESVTTKSPTRVPTKLPSRTPSKEPTHVPSHQKQTISPTPFLNLTPVPSHMRSLSSETPTTSKSPAPTFYPSINIAKPSTAPTAFPVPSKSQQQWTPHPSQIGSQPTNAPASPDIVVLPRPSPQPSMTPHAAEIGSSHSGKMSSSVLISVGSAAAGLFLIIGSVCIALRCRRGRYPKPRRNGVNRDELERLRYDSELLCPMKQSTPRNNYFSLETYTNLDVARLVARQANGRS